MKEIPMHSADLIAELCKFHKPAIVNATEMATEEQRLVLAEQQGAIRLVQDLKRKLDDQQRKKGNADE